MKLHNSHFTPSPRGPGNGIAAGAAKTARRRRSKLKTRDNQVAARSSESEA